LIKGIKDLRKLCFLVGNLLGLLQASVARFEKLIGTNNSTMGILKKIFGSKNQEEKVVERNSEPDMVYVPNTDELMNWAIEKANLTLGYFEKSLRSPESGQQYFSIKVKITDGENAEHIWLIEPEFDPEGNLFGVVGNDPVDVTNVSLNQKIGIDRSLISDWMIIENGRLVGGYTIRAIRETIPDSEKESFDQSLGLNIDEGSDFFEHDFSTPEGAILCLEDAYDEQDAEKAAACKDFIQEAKDMLSSVKAPGVNEDGEIVALTAETLRLSFMKYFQENSFPSFKNLRRAFPCRQKISDDLYIITEVVFHPNNTKSKQRLIISKTSEGWRVAGLKDE
jgi:uncharacterized protein YegJ (DUF2314 family)